MKKLKIWFGGLSLVSKTFVIALALILSFGSISAMAQSFAGTKSPSAVVESLPVVDFKTVTTTEPIPYKSSTIDDSSIEKGTTQLKTKGVDGVISHTYQITYKDGAEISRSTSTDVVTTPAIDEVILNGTKEAAPVCENGTYINSVGNTVCSPYNASSTPSGATAICGDGTYSFSQSRRGTCSHHGGVSTWL